jgi:hypothetical protein
VSSWRVETPWGWAVITGRLGQQHRDLLDVARMVAEREEWTTDGRMHLLVDPARLRSALGGDAVNNERIKDWLRELRIAQVEAHINDRDINIMGGIISDVVDAKAAAPGARPGAFHSERRMLHIVFGLAWSRLIESDREMRYPLAAVVGLKHGFSQAAARYCLSHRDVDDTIEGLMPKVAASGRVRDRISDLNDDKDGLRSMGIEVSGNRIRCGERRQNTAKREQSPVMLRWGASKVRWGASKVR